MKGLEGQNGGEVELWRDERCAGGGVVIDKGLLRLRKRTPSNLNPKNVKKEC